MGGGALRWLVSSDPRRQTLLFLFFWRASSGGCRPGTPYPHRTHAGCNQTQRTYSASTEHKSPLRRVLLHLILQHYLRHNFHLESPMSAGRERRPLLTAERTARRGISFRQWGRPACPAIHRRRNRSRWRRTSALAVDARSLPAELCL